MAETPDRMYEVQVISTLLIPVSDDTPVASRWKEAAQLADDLMVGGADWADNQGAEIALTEIVAVRKL